MQRVACKETETEVGPFRFLSNSRNRLQSFKPRLPDRPVRLLRGVSWPA
jgi:hypothetical protein